MQRGDAGARATEEAAAEPPRMAGMAIIRARDARRAIVTGLMAGVKGQLQAKLELADNRGCRYRIKAHPSSSPERPSRALRFG